MKISEEKNQNLEVLSYSEWNKRGRRIIKGEKAHSFKDGEAYFRRNQTYDPVDMWKTSSRFGITGEWDDQPF